MGEVVLFENPANYELVGRRIKRLLTSGDLEIKPHAQQRMRERNLHITDVQNILRHGWPVSHSRHEGAWRWKIRGTTIERKKATAVVEIEGLLIVVTVI